MHVPDLRHGRLFPAAPKAEYRTSVRCLRDKTTNSWRFIVAKQPGRSNLLKIENLPGSSAMPPFEVLHDLLDVQLSDAAAHSKGRMSWKLTETDTGFLLAGQWSAEPGSARITVAAVKDDDDPHRLLRGTPLPEAGEARLLALALLATARNPKHLASPARLAAVLNA